MQINSSKKFIALPKKIETTFEIDIALKKLEFKIARNNYEFYYKILLSKIKVSHYKNYFINQFQILLKRRKIQFSQFSLTSLQTSKMAATKSQIFDEDTAYFHSSTSCTKKSKKRKAGNKYLYTPYKYFHIIYTGMTS